MDKPAIKFSLCVFILMLLVSGLSLVAHAVPHKVTFMINSNDINEIYEAGIAKFKIENGETVDYELLPYTWKDRKKVLTLEPGLYGITVRKFGYIYNPFTKEFFETYFIVVYKEIEVNKDMVVYLFDQRI